MWKTHVYYHRDAMEKKRDLERVNGPIVQVLGNRMKLSMKKWKTPVSNWNRQFQCDPVRETAQKLLCDSPKMEPF